MPTVSEEFRSASRVADNIADIDAIKADLVGICEDEQLRAANDELLTRVRDRELEAIASVRVVVAAKLLALSVPTTRRWVQVGILQEVKNTNPKRVAFESVLAVRPHIAILRCLGKKRNLLEAVLARIDDEELMDDLRRGGSLDFIESELIEVPQDN